MAVLGVPAGAQELVGELPEGLAVVLRPGQLTQCVAEPAESFTGERSSLDFKGHGGILHNEQGVSNFFLIKLQNKLIILCFHLQI